MMGVNDLIIGSYTPITIVPNRCHRAQYSMAEESSSTTTVVPPHRPKILNGTYTSQNLIALNVSTQTPLKLTTTNYSMWWLQFTSLLFGYNLFGFVDGSKRCPPALITLSYATSPSSTLVHILWFRQDQLLLNAIVGSISATLVQFISTSTTSRAAWTTLEKTYAFPLRRWIMTYR